jgi:hypothetical protein
LLVLDPVLPADDLRVLAEIAAHMAAALHWSGRL